MRLINKKDKAMKLLVKDLMSNDVFSLYIEDNVSIAKEMMNWRAVRHIPVVDQKNMLVGLLTHRDLLRISVSSYSKTDEALQDQIHKKIPIGDVMQTNIKTVTPDTKISEAADLLVFHKFGCLPVVENRKLVGIITEADFVQFFVEKKLLDKNKHLENDTTYSN